jgi:hypothetical protein
MSFTMAKIFKFITFLFGIPVCALILANVVTDTSFWIVKVTAHDVWLNIVKRGPSDPSVFDIVQTSFAVVMALHIVWVIARSYGFNMRSFVRFGYFYWVFIPLVLCSPLIMAIPHFIARLLFSLPLPSEAVNGHSPTLSIIFFLTALAPI